MISKTKWTCYQLLYAIRHAIRGIQRNQLLYAIRHAIRGIQRRKLKNLISTLGILIGVSLLAGVQIATDSLVNGMQETVNLRYGNGDIIISKGVYQPEFFNYSLFENLENDADLKPYIDGIAPRITSQVFISSLTTKQTESFVTIIGINETLDNPFGALIPDDSYENNDFNFTALTDVQCIVGKELGEAVVEFDVEGTGRNEVISFPDTTQSMILGFIDAIGNASSTALVVKGIAKVEGKGVLEIGYTIFTKLQYIQAIYNTNGSKNINTIIVSTSESNDNARFVADMLEEKINFYIGKDEGVHFNVDPQKLEAYGDVEDSIKSFRIVLYVFGSLIIISGVLLILNITLMNIDEKQRSIGIMRAIGMTQKQLITVQLTESMILGGAGSVFGLGAGVLNGLGIIFLLENFLDIGSILKNIPLIVNPIGLVISFVIGIVISLLAALYPAWKASRINIVEIINEIETPQIDKRSGNWSIYTGFIVILAAGAAFTISLLIIPEWRWMMFIGSIFLFLFGMGFTLSRFVGPKIGFNSFALAWMIAGILSVVLLNPYLTELGIEQDNNLYVFLIGMLGLVFGTIIFIAINLEWLSNRFNDIFQAMSGIRAIGIISMRYIGKKKTRSALTFAIFGVILTMNVFLSVFTGSFTLGFDDFAEKEEGGVNIIAYSLSPVEPTGNPFETIKEADPENIVAVSGVKFRYSLTGAVMNLEFITTNETTTSTVEIPIPTDMWGVNDNFTDLTDYAFTDIWDGIEGDPWEVVKNGSKRYVILPYLIQEFEFDEDNTLFSVNH
ncbi:MAG: ABC transporter permease, partial [Candidatus Heimdallarchaeota archaeon]